MPVKIKILSTVHYRSLVNVGIAHKDGRLPWRPSNKHLHHGGSVCCYIGMAVANEALSAVLMRISWGALGIVGGEGVVARLVGEVDTKGGLAWMGRIH